MGMIEVMKAGAGHEEVKLEGTGAENKVKVDDLLSKKYAIMIEVGEGDKKETKKVTSFDADTNEFVIEEKTKKTVEETNVTRVSATTAKATAVAPVAGG